MRRLIMVLLAAGTVAGYSAGFCHIARHSGHWEGRWSQGSGCPMEAAGQDK